MAVLVQSLNFVLEAENDAWGVSGEISRRVQNAVENVIRRFYRRMVAEAKAAYPWEPMASRFKGAQSSSPRLGTYTATLYTDDPVFPALIEQTDPHRPPLRRHGIPGTGIEGWVLRLPPGPRPGFKRKITPWLVQKKIEEAGTPAKPEIWNILDRNQREFGPAVAAAIADAIMTDDWLV